MSLKVNTRQVGDVAVIDVSGRITLGEGSSVIRDTMRDLTTKGNKKILLNLGDVSYIDSLGIGELGRGIHECRERRGHGETAGPDQTCEGRAADHEALYRF
jgi:anti-sigma B factor antagonist